MADGSGIEWTDATWNPVVGCSIVSPGCTNCYAMKMAARLEAMGQPIYRSLTRKVNGNAVWTGKVELSNWGQVIKPLSWRRPRRIFVNSMSDLFHEALPVGAIDQVFAIMAVSTQHTFQVLTKRPKRMLDYLSSPKTPENIWRALRELARCDLGAVVDFMLDTPGALADYDRKIAARMAGTDAPITMAAVKLGGWPLKNVWIGVSAERQIEADGRIPLLLQTPAAVRFVSCEPLLGPIDLTHYLVGEEDPGLVGNCVGWTPPLDWIIAGGESGPRARPMHPDWARSLRDQCVAAGVPFFFKQWGEFAEYSQIGASGWESTGTRRGITYGRVSRGLMQGRKEHLFSGNSFETRYPFMTGPDPGPCMIRVGKKRAGARLDGREHRESPAQGRALA